MAWLKRWSPTQRRIFGVLLSCVGGVMYSFAFDPAQYTMDRKEGATQNALDYVYSQFSGIFVTSTFWFLLYCGGCEINTRDHFCG